MFKTRYARNGDINIAYHVVGDGPIDLVYIPAWASHGEAMWDIPRYARFLERIAAFSRLVVIDKRGTGASDRVVDNMSTDEQVNDVQAVMDEIGIERTAVFGAQEGGAIGLLYAATFPERTTALVTFGTWPRFLAAPDYPFGVRPDLLEKTLELMESAWSDPEFNKQYAIQFNPSLAHDHETLDGLLRMARFGGTPAGTTAMMRWYTATDLRSVLPTISCPTLVTHREHDAITSPLHGKYLSENVTGSRYLPLPGADILLPAGDIDVLLDEMQEFLTGSREVPFHERALATVLFTDFVDSTKRAAELGDHSWRELLDRHDSIVRARLDRFSGRLIRNTGDGILATFDGPARAIRCARELRDEVSGLGLDIRAGVHIGEVEVRGPELSGIAMNIGARVMESASGGEVLVSQTVKDIVAGSGIEFLDRGSHELKGVPGEWHLYAVAS